MINKGLLYHIEAEYGKNISTFANEIAEFRKSIKKDIIAKFDDVYIIVNDKMTPEDIIKEFYEASL